MKKRCGWRLDPKYRAIHSILPLLLRYRPDAITFRTERERMVVRPSKTFDQLIVPTYLHKPDPANEARHDAVCAMPYEKRKFGHPPGLPRYPLLTLRPVSANMLIHLTLFIQHFSPLAFSF